VITKDVQIAVVQSVVKMKSG